MVTLREGKNQNFKASFSFKMKKTIIFGKAEGIRERGRPNKRWIDSIKEPMALGFQDLSKAISDCFGDH